MRRARIAAAAAAGATLLAAAAAAQIPSPVRTAPAIEIATSPALAPLLRRLAADYRRGTPGAPIAIDPVGSDVAMARLNTGRADAAVIGRVGFQQEIKAHEWVYRGLPKATPLFRGSVALSGHSPALAVRVNAANPIRAITPAQLAALFRVGDPAPRWQVAGVGGAFGARPATAVVPATDGGTGRYMRQQMLDGIVQLDWRRVREEPRDERDGGFDRRIAAAVARDPAAVGVGAALPMAGTRIVPVVVDGTPRLPGEAGYPYERQVIAYTARAPRPEAAAFVAYVRSRAAAPAIAATGYRPL